MKIQIKERGCDRVIFECDAASIGEAVKLAIEAKANLRSADLSSANLRSANLRYANLSSANLRSANLRYANLRYANLSSADLSSADLSSADLSSADLSSANLRSADLRYADLRYADLRSANLRSANLSYADLRYADLSYAENSKLAIAMTRILPEGEIIGWKKCSKDVIVKLVVPAAAKRLHAFSRKCRAEFATVVEVIGDHPAVSLRDSSFIYKVGEIVRPREPFCEDFTKERSSGIHFYITREEAEAHS